MITRRNSLTLAALAALLPLSARAQGTERASAFVKDVGDKLVAVVNARQRRNSRDSISGCFTRFW
jgi:hypothetical protein